MGTKLPNGEGVPYEDRGVVPAPAEAVRGDWKRVDSPVVWHSEQLRRRDHAERGRRLAGTTAAQEAGTGNAAAAPSYEG